METCLGGFKRIFVVFHSCMWTATWYTKSCPNGSSQDPESRWKIDFMTCVSIGGASRKAGVEKTLATLRSEPPRTSIYGVLLGQNVTFRLLALAIKVLEKTSPELPVGSPNAVMFHES